MPAVFQELTWSIHIFVAACASAAGALSLLQLKPLQKPFHFGTLTVAFGLTCVLLPLSPMPELAALGLLAAYLVAVRFIFHADSYYLFMDGLLMALFLCLHQLLCQSLLGSAALSEISPTLPGLLTIAVDISMLIVAGLCCWLEPALLPDPDTLPTVSDRVHRRKLRFSLIYVLLSLAALDGWVLFALAVRDMLVKEFRFALITLTLLLSALLLGYVHRLSFSVMERIEALMDKQYQSDLLSFMQVIRSQRHDFNFHMRTISGLIHQGQYQECDEYIDQMAKNAGNLNNMLPLRHPATSAIIHTFGEMAVQKGIEFDVSISSDLAQLPCTIYETNTIIGNLLQNAIDELEQEHDHGPIRLLILFRGGYYIIRVTNPCKRSPEELQNIFQPGYSTKQSHEGIGLATVQRIVHRYDGYVFPEFNEGSISLIVQIPFCA